MYFVEHVMYYSRYVEVLNIRLELYDTNVVVKLKKIDMSAENIQKIADDFLFRKLY
jgi:hypothetical protein